VGFLLCLKYFKTFKNKKLKEEQFMLLKKTIGKIEALCEDSMKQARERLDSLIKPPGSLGCLEEIAVQLAGITRNPRPQIKDRTVILMGGDHGVVEEGISAAPQEITWQMMHNFSKGGAGISVLSRLAGAKLVVVDIGVASSVPIPGALNYKVRPGTGNIAKGPAMTKEEAKKALEIGIEIALNEINKGASILALGDMGIGNTTPSGAILVALSGCSIVDAAGRGTLVNDEILEKKVKVIKQALETNRPDPENGLDVLAKVGGLEIAGLAGVILGAASQRIPVMVDGFIATAAAMISAKLAPASRHYMIASHLSEEHGHYLMLKHLGLTPMLHMNMRLGEGTGAVLAFHMVEAATRILNEMHSFAEAGVSGLLEDNLLS
jgi:nicotinate-nucleotide--dimethylbenzimidazole phosphoribosyltransferase